MPAASAIKTVHLRTKNGFTQQTAKFNRLLQLASSNAEKGSTSFAGWP
jgi:hypothetical protein